MLKKLDKFFVFVTVFMNGWIYALPLWVNATVAADGEMIISQDVPRWLSPLQVIHGVNLYEFLVLVYLVIMVVGRAGRLPVFGRDARRIACLIAGVGCLGLISTCMNLRDLIELATSSRYFLMAAYLLLCIHWSKRYSPAFVLRTLLLGIAASGAVNLYYTFTVRWMEIGGVPLLMGRNGPGGLLGISVIISAWLMLERESRLDAAIAIACGIVGFVGASTSMSKQAILMAGCGLVAWGIILLQVLSDRRSRRMSAFALVALLSVVLLKRDIFTQYVQGINECFHDKFDDVTSKDSSIWARFQYLPIVSEIVVRNPFFGVGYGGFYKAVIATEGYKSDKRVEENAESGAQRQSHPHNTFLYYAAVNGLPGLLLAVLLFLNSLAAIWQRLTKHGVPGRITWACLAFGYFVYGMVTITLYNTSILLLPVAVAVALGSQPCSRGEGPNLAEV